MKSFDESGLDWEKGGGLVPVIIQDRGSAQVLMLGYVNKEALQCTLSTQEVHFYSRVKQRLWKKGETSGNVLYVHEIYKDCDEDALLILVDIHGPCCHLQETSCFKGLPSNIGVLASLESRILARKKERSNESYTSQLFNEGLTRMAQKVGEEGVEVALAAALGNSLELMNESADLIYHLLVLLAARDIAFLDVLKVLQKGASSR